MTERKFNTDYRQATQTQPHTNHNLLLLGDSHTRGLAEMIGCSLGNSFSVTGITKPNADINGITSPRHFVPDNLTKQDMIIFCGGTRDISRNEAKSGLCSLMEFAQRTSNTNVILLEAPHRYDLPLSSCVNMEARLFNKRMRSLMTPFRHVKVLNMSTEREHHTRHGLHLNKKGKYWVTNNLVKKIKNFYFPHNITPPIVLQWKDANENTTEQVSQTEYQDKNTSVTKVSGNQTENQAEDLSLTQVSDNLTDNQTEDVSVTQQSENPTANQTKDVSRTQASDNLPDNQTEAESVPQTNDDQIDSQAKDISVLQASDNQTDKQAPDISVTQVSNNSTQTTIPQQTGSITDQTDPLNQAKVPNRNSSRQKKLTQTKSNYFLW